MFYILPEIRFGSLGYSREQNDDTRVMTSESAVGVRLTERIVRR
jgi:hypothetical protein